eukprot:GABU01000252.1.p1 GENE.GABU01000252.1~~GABU01000252.1.p1  ORF type:complete len:109 (+),score=1.35 GABU01000252.1:27-329(+)
MKQAFKEYSEDHSTSSERGGTPTPGVSSHRLPVRSAGTSQKVALFVGGLAFNITEREIQEYFEQFAPVIKIGTAEGSEYQHLQRLCLCHHRGKKMLRTTS